MHNDFFVQSDDKKSILLRLEQLDKGKVGFYSVGLYPASLAYNCVMQNSGNNLLLAPREGRELLGAFDSSVLTEMKAEYITKMQQLSRHKSNGKFIVNNLSYLISTCDLVVLSANSNYIEKDLSDACNIREKLKRYSVVIACLVGSFCFDEEKKKSYVLCQRYPSLAFFSGFHRHGSLRNPSDSFTANFCQPDSLTAFLGARLLDKLSPNIQVTPGVHNIEAQYIKATKNISSIFAGFAHTFHKRNTGILPTLLTLLLEQCLNQAATVSMSRPDRVKLYSDQRISITELGYGVQRIEAALLTDGDLKEVRDHTFSQLTAIVADIKGSMMQPQSGSPTRNFQVGSILAKKIFDLERCPNNLAELIDWCECSGLPRGGLEGITSLEHWPDILKMYKIQMQDASMINLLYISIFGDTKAKELSFQILTNSRELTTYCTESVKHQDSNSFKSLISQFYLEENLDQIVEAIQNHNQIQLKNTNVTPSSIKKSTQDFRNKVFSMMQIIEASLI